MFTGPQYGLCCTRVVSLNIYVPLLDKWIGYGPPNADLLVRKMIVGVYRSSGSIKKKFTNGP